MPHRTHSRHHKSSCIQSLSPASYPSYPHSQHPAARTSGVPPISAPVVCRIRHGSDTVPLPPRTTDSPHSPVSPPSVQSIPLSIGVYAASPHAVSSTVQQSPSYPHSATTSYAPNESVAIPKSTSRSGSSLNCESQGCSSSI